jgi:DNA-binding NarL/FixJ family response regulator
VTVAKREDVCSHHRALARQLTLLIADDAPTRRGIKLTLPARVRVCAEAADVEHAIRAAKREQPDVALIGRDIADDIRNAVRGICRAAPGCACVVLAPSGDADEMLESIRAGALGYVPGALDGEHLARVLSAVTDKEAVVPRTMVSVLLSELRGGGAGGEPLSARGAQVLGMLRRGHSTAQIAERLQITPVTVRRHISELVHKLGVESRDDLM